MRTRRKTRGGPGKLARLLLMTLIAWGAGSWLALSEEPGTVGLGLAQLYSDGQENRRGSLVVLRVVDGSPAAKAGIEKGDLIVSIDGSPVAGQDLGEVLRQRIRGPIGGHVRLHVAKPDGKEADLDLTRAAYPPHKTAESDLFSYLIPGSWRMDPRVNFPLPWSPAIPYHGNEDLAFAPSFDDAASPEYHSYLFFWWIEGSDRMSADRLQTDMVTYFKGLAEERGKDRGFAPDLSKISARYTTDVSGPREFGGAPAQTFRGDVDIYDTRGQVIRLHSEVVAAACPGTGHTAAFFGMSLEPRDGGVWKDLDAIRDTFHCKS